jgi:hypothetical protein
MRAKIPLRGSGIRRMSVNMLCLFLGIRILPGFGEHRRVVAGSAHPSKFWLIIKILNIAILLLVTTEISKAADVIWLSCKFQNARPVQSEPEEQIYAFSEKERKLWSYQLSKHELVIIEISQIEKDLITAYPFRSQMGKGESGFNQNFVMYMNRVTGAYFRGLPGVADTGACSPTEPQPVNDLRTKF